MSLPADLEAHGDASSQPYQFEAVTWMVLCPPMSNLDTLLRWTTRRNMRRLAVGLGAGSGVFAVIGAFSSSHAAVVVGCGAASGVLSMIAALLMNDRFCNGDVESRVRTGSQNGTELVELEVVSQEVPNRSQFSGRHSSGIGELETLDNGSIHSSRYSPNNDAVALAHSKHEQEPLEDEIGSIDIGTVSQGAIEASTQAPEDRTRESTPTTRIPPHDEPKAQPNSTTLALDLENNSSLHHRNVPLGPSDVAGVENQLRRLYNISPAVPVDLYAIPDPLCPPFTQIAIIQIAIWSSEQRKLTQAQIWSRIEQRFRIESVKEAKKWKVSTVSCLLLPNSH
ncbi:hypothetical protein PM082_022508 [Marasmius tenuissimus]|nr:hypothetical protein PM082_022508 [Marasmius tenuissimus]